MCCATPTGHSGWEVLSVVVDKDRKGRPAYFLINTWLHIWNTGLSRLDCNQAGKQGCCCCCRWGRLACTTGVQQTLSCREAIWGMEGGGELSQTQLHTKKNLSDIEATHLYARTRASPRVIVQETPTSAHASHTHQHTTRTHTKHTRIPPQRG